MTTVRTLTISRFSMKPDYIEEIEVDEQMQIKHKAACVWKLLGTSYSQDQLQQYCALYEISIDQAQKWKSYWLDK